MIDDNDTAYAQSIVLASLITAVFQGRQPNDPVALDFIGQMERKAVSILEAAPLNASVLLMASKVAKVAAGIATGDGH